MTLPPDRLERLIDVGRSLLSELQLELVLDRLLEVAAELTGARYVALGVLDEERAELARFITRGVDPETHRAIGDLPRGRGILGVLIEEPRPLRLDDVAADARSYGFPTGHPPMRTFLGVPVLIRGEAWGNLYLTEKEGGAPFDADDEETVIVLADWAAIAIENARLYEAAGRRRDELERAVRGLEATLAIAEAVGAETDLRRILELVVKRARALVHARRVIVALREGDDLVVAAVAGEGGVPLGSRVALPSGTLRQPRRLDAGAAELTEVAASFGVPEARAALLVPLLYRGRPVGRLLAFDRLRDDPSFTVDDEQVLRAFAASAATAVATAQTVESERLRHSLRAAEAERGRWARELHDETLQGLAALRVLLSAAARSDDATLRAAVEDAVGHVTGEIDNLRAIISDLRPAALDMLGLAPALETLVQRTGSTPGLEVQARVELRERLPSELETTVYRLVQEALTNVVKHAGAAHARVEVADRDGAVEVVVADDGRGFDPSRPTAGFGLVGMRERVALAGGELVVEPAAPGTRVRARLPRQASSSPRSSA